MIEKIRSKYGRYSEYKEINGPYISHISFLDICETKEEIIYRKLSGNKNISLLNKIYFDISLNNTYCKIYQTLKISKNFDYDLHHVILHNIDFNVVNLKINLLKQIMLNLKISNRKFVDMISKYKDIDDYLKIKNFFCMYDYINRFNIQKLYCDMELNGYTKYTEYLRKIFYNVLERELSILGEKNA